MPTSKNANIQDFFKPSAKPRLNKRPPSDDMIDGSRVNQRSQSSMPDRLISTEPNVTSNSPSKQMRLPIVSDKVEGIVYNLTNGSLSTGQGLVNGESRQHGEISRKEETELVGSEGPVLTSSQRVIRNGEVMIRNSDDESGSDVSLDDIDDLLVARKTATVSPPLTETEISCPAEVEHIKEETKIVTRSKTRGSRRAQASLAKSILPGLPKYTFSLDSLEERSNADKELEEGTARAKLLLKSLEHSNGTSAEKAQKSSKNESRVDAGLIMTVMKDKNDEEGISRLMTAIQRTEAFDQVKTWSFFSRSKDPTLLEQVAFPAIQDLKWRDILVDTISRHQAFLGGFVSDMASKERLPEELLLWVLDEVCLEPRDDLRYSYICSLKKSQNKITPLLSPSRIDMLFRRTGASIEALNIKKPITPLTVLSQEKEDKDWSRVLSMLDLMGQISQYMTTESSTHAICMLCRLLLDTEVIKAGEVITAIQAAFQNLFKSISDPNHQDALHHILSTTYDSVADSAFRLQLLQHIPVSSPQLNLFRRRLALAFFHGNKSFLFKLEETLLNLRSIVQHLQTQQFIIQNNTDFHELTAIIAILSIGIDSCDAPPLSSDSQQKAAFNMEIDLLAQKINAMFASIVDTGASHMKRTDAKEVLEAFHSRLLYAVRTEPKPKSMMFGDSIAGEESALMKNFLNKFVEPKTIETEM